MDPSRKSKKRIRSVSGDSSCELRHQWRENDGIYIML